MVRNSSLDNSVETICMLKTSASLCSYLQRAIEISTPCMLKFNYSNSICTQRKKQNGQTSPENQYMSTENAKTRRFSSLKKIRITATVNPEPSQTNK